MIINCTALCLTLVVAMNALLATANGAVLCLHDHDFAHLLAQQHSEDGDRCHSHEANSHHVEAVHGQDTSSEYFAINEPHCLDIIFSSIDEPIQRVYELTLTTKPVVAAHQYKLSAPISRAIAGPQLRVATRAPPFLCSSLEQCVRKTVLRI